MKKPFLIIGTIILALILATFAYFRFYWPTTASDNPSAAIKKYVVQKGHPIQALSLDIEDKKIEDETYGHAFYVEGYKSGFAEVSFFYLRQTREGWYVTSAGTGP